MNQSKYRLTRRRGGRGENTNSLFPLRVSASPRETILILPKELSWNLTT